MIFLLEQDVFRLSCDKHSVFRHLKSTTKITLLHNCERVIFYFLYGFGLLVRPKI